MCSCTSFNNTVCACASAKSGSSVRLQLLSLLNLAVTLISRCKVTNECLSADPDLLKQLFTKSFMKFHDRPDMQMRLAEGDEITTEGMLAAKCAQLPLHHSLHSDRSEVTT